ncbi:MAG: hypothetical protein KGY99_10515, partial [Phycisphaerae bacterium]|nr:hypothetical protein [Phycisphaerae bacterium]
LGPRRARRLSAALATAATGIPAGLAALGGAPRVLLGAPLLLVLLATPFGAMRRGRRLPDADALTARFAAALIAAIALACALAPRAP